MTDVGGESGFAGRLILLIALAILLAFAFQGSRGLYETTEGRYAESAREMLETGNWLVPQLDYEPHWSKPPLTYWVLAGGMLLLGENEWGVRAAPAVAYLIIVWAVYGLGAAMWGRRTAFAAALIYATSPFAVVAANSVSTDPILAMWEALSALAYWTALVRWRSDRRASSRWIVLFWLFAGLGFLTKGPPALLTMLVVFIFHGWRIVARREAPVLASRLGIPVFVAVSSWWFVAVGLAHPGLLEMWVSEEVVGRVVDPTFNRNPGWYGPLVVLVLP
ncbi:MAG: glycosyltransferase family 39 protein, partial [Candidatus Eisenbacteria bacterium]|nr:glycosyltransferase family 39 protein [Candidatus Eisenbacteria bacterium]